MGPVDGGQREYRRVRLARAARGDGQFAAGQAEDRTSRQRRHDRNGGRAGLRCRDRRRRFRAFDAKNGKELWTVKLGGAAEATPMTYEGKDGRQYVVITSTGGGFFNNPVTDDSVMAFAAENKNRRDRKAFRRCAFLIASLDPRKNAATILALFRPPVG